MTPRAAPQASLTILYPSPYSLTHTPMTVKLIVDRGVFENARCDLLFHEGRMKEEDGPERELGVVHGVPKSRMFPSNTTLLSSLLYLPYLSLLASPSYCRQQYGSVSYVSFGNLLLTTSRYLNTKNLSSIYSSYFHNSCIFL